MSQENRYLTVTALNKYLAYKFDNDNHLRRIYIKGEISNYRISNGHAYFILKDDNSEISVIMFQSSRRNVKFTPKDGMTVLIEGKVSVYDVKGTYSIHAHSMDEVGLGQLYLNFLQLKQKLEEEGLFDPKYKKPLPLFPEKIGVITSGTGDALHDIVQTINKRFPLAEIFLYPALVQGVDAPKDLVRALRKANLDGYCDVIILGRGGGSFEDLSAFNDELLAREVFNSFIPVISAIGHESDFTICDFVSDFRAPTPTGAAVIVTKEKSEIKEFINSSVGRINSMINVIIKQKSERLSRARESYGLKNFNEILDKKNKLFSSIEQRLYVSSPINQINNNIVAVNNLVLRLENIGYLERINNYEKEISSNIKILSKYTIDKLNLYNDVVTKNIDKLYILNPLNLIKKGYTITYQDGKIIRQSSELSMEETIDIRFTDGLVKAKLISRIEEKMNE